MANFKTIQDLMNHNEQLDKMGYCLEMLSCFECEEWYECRFAFNHGNADMECLKDKENGT